jgi:hypothetical protein
MRLAEKFDWKGLNHLNIIRFTTIRFTNIQERNSVVKRDLTVLSTSMFYLTPKLPLTAE